MDLAYYPTLWDRLMMTLTGLVIVVLALIALALVIMRRDALAERTQALAGGLSLGLLTGLVGGTAFLIVQSFIGAGFLLGPGRLLPGLYLGLGFGALAVLAISAFVTFRSAPIVGPILGAVAGLALFRLIFGPTAGFGGEVGLGVGREVGVMFGVAGGLLGGILGHAVSLVARPMGAYPAHNVLDANSPPRPGWRWPLIGLALGALGGALVGALGAYMGLFAFLVPYNGQIPDVPPDTSLAGMLHDLLFGLGMFAVGGALIGCFLALQWMSSGGTGARRYRVWLGVGLVIALIGALSFGLNQTGVGGPAPLLAGPRVPYDPAAGLRGLLLGLAGGVVVGALLLVFARITRAHARWRMIAWQLSALAIGVLLLTLPFWYIPVIGFSMH